MKATHINYKHPRHLRVEHNEKDGSGGVWCVAPGCDTYKKTFRPALPDWNDSTRQKNVGGYGE